ALGASRSRGVAAGGAVTNRPRSAGHAQADRGHSREGVQSPQSVTRHSRGHVRVAATPARPVLRASPASVPRATQADQRQGQAKVGPAQELQSSETTENPHADGATESHDFTARK